MKSLVCAIATVSLAALVGLAGMSFAANGGGDEAESEVTPTLEGGAVARDRRFGPDYATFAPDGTWMLLHAAELIEPWKLGDDAHVSSAGRLVTTLGDAFGHADLVPFGVTIADGLLWNRNDFAVRIFVSNGQSMIEIDMQPKQGVVFGAIENIVGIVTAPNDRRGCRCQCIDNNGNFVRESIFECSCDCGAQNGGACLDSNGNQVAILQSCDIVVFPAIDLSLLSE